jgi:uncharacterized protein YhbP (UPF0306 family)
MRKRVMQKRITQKKKLAAVRSFLSGCSRMVLATEGVRGPWAATVFFAHDRAFRFFFFSRTDTRHAQNIAAQPRVAAALNGRASAKHIKGIQLCGTASRITREKHPEFFALFKKRFPWAREFPDHELFVIRPSELYYIDEDLFGHFFRERIL